MLYAGFARDQSVVIAELGSNIELAGIEELDAEIVSANEQLARDHEAAVEPDRRAAAPEQLRREVRDAGEGQFLAGGERVAEQVDGAQEGMAGICLRGLPGWGEMFAPLTTVVVPPGMRYSIDRHGLGVLEHEGGNR